jgi:hypothetical protein
MLPQFIFVVADLVLQLCTKSMTTNMEWREYKRHVITLLEYQITSSGCMYNYTLTHAKPTCIGKRDCSRLERKQMDHP